MKKTRPECDETGEPDRGRYRREVAAAGYQCKYWLATKDVDDSSLSRWLDEQVGEALHSYIEDGQFWLEPDGEVCFIAGEARGDTLGKRASLAELVAELIGLSGTFDAPRLETLRRARAVLAGAVAELDRAVAHYESLS